MWYSIVNSDTKKGKKKVDHILERVGTSQEGLNIFLLLGGVKINFFDFPPHTNAVYYAFY